MYFSNIHNPELQHFHGTTGVDFTMSLTDILESDLFEIENLGNNIYRVFPLFYCKTIISSNLNDKILDSRCLILNKREKETYLTFRTQQNNNNIIFDDNLMNAKKINDTLSIDEFNAMVYMLRSINTLEGMINFEDSVVFNGVYATYELDNSGDIARNDSGFIITPELKRTPLTIRLVNSFFLNARYVLSCTVRSLVGANILNEDNTNYKTVDTFTVELVEGREVGLDVTGYVDDSVLDFEMGINIDFNTPEIVNRNFTLSLSSEHEMVFIGENVELVARLTGEDNVTGYMVQFFEDNVLIGNGTTNDEGVAVLEYQPEIIGSHVYSCKTVGLTDNAVVTISKYHSNLSLSSDKSIAYIPTTFTVSGVLIDERGAVSNARVLLYNNNSLLATLTTGDEGEFSHIVSVSADSSFNLQAKFEDTPIVIGSNSSYVNVTARKLNVNLSINTNRSTVYHDQTVSITGALTDELGSAISNANVSLYNGDTLVSSTTTNSNGAYSFTRPWVKGTYSFKVVYDGDETHNSKTSSTKTVYMTKIPTTTTILNPKSEYSEGDTVLIKVSSNYGSFTPESITVILGPNLQSVSVKDSDGNFIYTIPGGTVDNGNLIAEYTGNEYYDNSYHEINVNVTGIVDELNLTLQGDRKFIINCKKNGAVVKNKKISGLTFGITLPRKSFDLSNTSTDINGNITYNLSGYDNYGGTAYVVYGSIVSFVEYSPILRN